MYMYKLDLALKKPTNIDMPLKLTSQTNFFISKSFIYYWCNQTNCQVIVILCENNWINQSLKKEFDLVYNKLWLTKNGLYFLLWQPF